MTTKRPSRIPDLTNHPTIPQKGKHNMIVKLRNVRLAFAAIFEAKSFEGSDPAFSGSFIMPKNHPDLKELNAVIEQVAQEKWKDKADGILKTLRAGDKLCLRDGDTKAEYDGFAGNVYVSARNKSRPLVMDKNKTELSVADGKPYAGCYVDVSLDVWPQDNKFGKRINATLRGVQFRADGDAFAGGAPASEDDFDDLSDGSDADTSLL